MTARGLTPPNTRKGIEIAYDISGGRVRCIVANTRKGIEIGGLDGVNRSSFRTPPNTRKGIEIWLTQARSRFLYFLANTRKGIEIGSTGLRGRDGLVGSNTRKGIEIR